MESKTPKSTKNSLITNIKKNFLDTPLFKITLSIILVLTIGFLTLNYRINRLYADIDIQKNAMIKTVNNLNTKINKFRNQNDVSEQKINQLETDLRRISKLEQPIFQPQSESELIFDIQMASYQLHLFHNIAKGRYWLEKAQHKSISVEVTNKIAIALAILNKINETKIEDALTEIRNISNRVLNLELDHTIVRQEQSTTPVLSENINTHSQTIWGRFQDAVSDYIVISNDNDQDRQLWLRPKNQSIFITDFTLNMNQAQWAILNRNNTLFQKALSDSIELLKNYKSRNETKLDDIRTQIIELQKVDVDPNMPDLNPILLLIIDKSVNNSNKTEEIKQSNTRSNIPSKRERDLMTPQAPQVSEEF